jgi:N-acetylglutamate synthase-like GNAT family acetyltransferase
VARAFHLRRLGHAVHAGRLRRSSRSASTPSAAERLLAQGRREGALKHRSPAEVAAVLASGFGALVSGRHLAGVAALLTQPYTADHCGEVAGLYTITRFKGEGLGARLVDRILAEAAASGLEYVFACALRRARRFFQQMGFVRVKAEDVPAAKWLHYDRRRRARLAVFRRQIAAERHESVGDIPVPAVEPVGDTSGYATSAPLPAPLAPERVPPRAAAERVESSSGE